MPHSWIDRRTAGVMAAVFALVMGGTIWLLDGIVHPPAETVADVPVGLTIDGQRLTIPAPLFRFADQRRGGALSRADLALLWPDLTGRTSANLADFEDEGPQSRIVYVTLEPRGEASDPASRLTGLYMRFVSDEALTRDGLEVRGFRPGTPYEGETVHFEPNVPRPFIARCYRVDATDARSCLMEFPIGERLMAAVRIRPPLLADWRRLSATLRTRLSDFLAP